MSVGGFWSFWSLEDHFEIIVESLWVYEGPFSKNIHFPNRFLSLYKTTGWILDRFGVTLGPCFAYEAAFGSTLGSLCGHFGHIDVEFHT